MVKSNADKRLNYKLNIWISILIFILGTSSLIVSAFSKENENFLLSFRYMTFNGTVFSTLVSLIVIALSFSKVKSEKAYKQNILYYFRLSSAVTEIIIAVVIALSFLPSVPDNPNLLSYDSFNMHVIIPLLTVISFLLHPSPAEKTGALLHLSCAWLITIYSAVIMTLIVFGLIPESLIPYSFLDVHSMPVWYIITFGLFIYSFVYVLSYWLTGMQERICIVRSEKTKPVGSK